MFPPLLAAATTAGATPIEEYSLWLPILEVALGTLIYLLIDVYLSTKTFRGIAGCGAFWLLYVVFCLFGLIAFGALKVAAGDKILAFVGHAQLAALLHAILAVAGALTVFQSFSLKLSDFKVMDMGQFVDQFRNLVKAAITQRVAKLERASNLKTIDLLAKLFDGRELELRGFLSTVLYNSGMDVAAVANDIQVIETHYQANSLKLSRGYAERLVVVDADYAKTLK